MQERRIPTPHKPLEEIVKYVRRGYATGVDDAVLNGDLVGYPESWQRIIVACVHDNVACSIRNYMFPTNTNQKNVYDEVVEKHLRFAVNVFFKADGKSLKDEILEFRNG